MHTDGVDAVQLHNAAREVVRPGEHVLWAGEPRKGLLLRRSDLWFVPFTSAWAGFAVFWTISATSGGAPPFFTIWGCLFIAIGCYLVVGRFFADAWQRKDTFYVLTDQRLVVRSGRRSRSELSTPLSQLGAIEFAGQSGGRGTIRYGTTASRQPLGSFELPPGWPGASRYQRPMLDSISNARDVYDQVVAAVQTASMTTSG
jgi:hypothetical protein